MVLKVVGFDPSSRDMYEVALSNYYC